MVRPLICCMGTRGDVQPFIALALGLLAAEDEPLLLVPPEYLSYVAEYDIPVQPYTKSMQVSALTTEDGQTLQQGDAAYEQATLEENTGQLFQPLFKTWLQETVAWAQHHDADVIVLTQWLWLAGGVVLPTLCNKPHIKVYFIHLVPGTRTSAFAQPTATTGVGFSLAPLNLLSWWLAERMVLQGLYRKLALEAVQWVAAFQHISPPPPLPDDFGQSACTNLYAYSRHLLPKPKDWPSNCKVVGGMLLPGADYDGPFPDGVDVVLHDAFQQGYAVVYIGFASMLEAFTGPDAAATVGQLLLDAMRQVAARMPVKCIIQTGEGTGTVNPSPFLPETVEAFWKEGLGVVINHSFPHAVVFPRCQLVITHGGVGTIHTALAAGAPVTACPCQSPSDQGFWADLLVRKGLGPKCAPLHQMTATAWRHVIQQGLHKHEEYTAAAREMADKLREEHGVAQVVAFLAAGV